MRIIDGSTRFQSGRNQNLLTDDDVDALLEAYRDASSELDSIRQSTVDVDDIKNRGWDLSIGRFIEQDGSETVDVAGALAAMKVAELATASAQLVMHQRLEAAGYA